MPWLLWGGAGALILYLAGKGAEEAGEAAAKGAELARALALLVALYLAAVYLPRLVKP